MNVEDLITKQTNQLLKIARDMDTRGYAIMVSWHSWPPTRESERPKIYIDPQIAAAAYRYILRGRSNALLIHLEPTINWNIQTKQNVPGIYFTCRISGRVVHRPIHGALQLVSKERYDASNVGLIRRRMADGAAYYGYTRDALEILVRVLDMPHHREILTSPR